MIKRYKVRGINGCYGAYDLQEKKFVSPLFPAWDNPHEPHTNAMSDGYKKARALCYELNMTDRYRVVRKNTLYYIYDNESKRYIESHFVFESDALIVCEELNRKAKK